MAVKGGQTSSRGATRIRDVFNPIQVHDVWLPKNSIGQSLSFRQGIDRSTSLPNGSSLESYVMAVKGGPPTHHFMAGISRIQGKPPIHNPANKRAAIVPNREGSIQNNRIRRIVPSQSKSWRLELCLANANMETRMKAVFTGNTHAGMSIPPKQPQSDFPRNHRTIANIPNSENWLVLAVVVEFSVGSYLLWCRDRTIQWLFLASQKAGDSNYA